MNINNFIKKAKSKLLIKKIKHSTPRNLLFGAKGLHNENIIIHCEKQNSEILPSTWIISINDITGSTLNLHKLLIDNASLEYYLELFNSLFAYIKEEASAIKNSMQTLIFHFPENFKEKSHFAEKLFLAVRQNFSFIKHYNYSYSSSKVSWILLTESLECFNDFIKIENIKNDLDEHEEKQLVINKIILKDYTYKFQTDYVILHSDIINKDNFPSFTSNKKEKKPENNKKDLKIILMEINQSDRYNKNIDPYHIDLFYNYSINATEFYKRVTAINYNYILPLIDDDQIENLLEIKKAFDIILKLLNSTYIDFAKIVENKLLTLTTIRDDNNINSTLKFFIKWFIEYHSKILEHSQVINFDYNYENIIKFNFNNFTNFDLLKTSKSKEVEVFKTFLDKFCNYVNIPEDDIINNNITKEQRHKIIEHTKTFYKEFTVDSQGTTPFEFSSNISNFITAFVNLLPTPEWKTEHLKVNVNDFENDIHESTDEYKFKSLLKQLIRDYYENIITTDTYFLMNFLKVKIFLKMKNLI